jgi:hypothetical protein
MPKKIQFSLILCVVVSICCSAQIHSRLPKYCDQPLRVVPTLKLLRHKDWNSIDKMDIRNVWTTELEEDTGCSSTIGSETTPCVILANGPCDKEFCCGVAFFFDTPIDQSPLFDTVVVNITNNSRTKLASAIESFLEALSPVTEEAVDPGPLLGWNPSTDPRAIHKAYSFKSTNGSEVGIVIELEPQDNDMWWLRLQLGTRS